MGVEVVLYAGLTTIWWISSYTILLPFLLLLRFNKTFRDKWFSFFFVKFIGPLFNPRLIPSRKRAFELLKEHLSKRVKSVPLEVLEIGVGSGANLQFYPKNSILTALDMNASFEEYFKENQKRHPNVSYKRTVTCMAEDMKDEVADSSMDLVICTYVLCSVIDIVSVLKEVKRVLKPGGNFLFLEHIAYPKNEWSNTIQRLASPLWRVYFDGCCPDRDIKESITKAGFTDLQCEDNIPVGVVLYVRPQIIGIATK